MTHPSRAAESSSGADTVARGLSVAALALGPVALGIIVLRRPGG